jgi:hypothetical protein
LLFSFLVVHADIMIANANAKAYRICCFAITTYF